MVMLVLCATLAGANDFVAVRLWGEQALPFLRRLLPYEDGLPSHDTLGDVMNALDPELFKECFLGWVETLRSFPWEMVHLAGGCDAGASVETAAVQARAAVRRTAELVPSAVLRQA